MVSQPLHVKLYEDSRDVVSCIRQTDRERESERREKTRCFLSTGRICTELENGSMAAKAPPPVGPLVISGGKEERVPLPHSVKGN